MLSYVLLIILVTLIVLIVYIINKKIDFDKIIVKDFKDINLQTGDLVLFRWHTVDILHDIISPFTHVGIVIILNNKKYILETHLKGDTKHMGNEAGGVHLYELQKRIDMYDGDNFILKIKDNLINDTNSQTLYNNFSLYSKIPFHDNYTGHYKNYCLPKMACDKCFAYYERKGMFCSEFVGFLLQELKILDKKHPIDCLTPSSFLYLNIGNDTNNTNNTNNTNDTNSANNGLIYTDIYKIYKENKNVI